MVQYIAQYKEMLSTYSARHVFFKSFAFRHSKPSIHSPGVSSPTVTPIIRNSNTTIQRSRKYSTQNFQLGACWDACFFLVLITCCIVQHSLALCPWVYSAHVPSFALTFSLSHTHKRKMTRMVMTSSERKIGSPLKVALSIKSYCFYIIIYNLH